MENLFVDKRSSSRENSFQVFASFWSGALPTTQDPDSPSKAEIYQLSSIAPTNLQARLGRGRVPKHLGISNKSEADLRQSPLGAMLAILTLPRVSFLRGHRLPPRELLFSTFSDPKSWCTSTIGSGTLPFQGRTSTTSIASIFSRKNLCQKPGLRVQLSNWPSG